MIKWIFKFESTTGLIKHKIMIKKIAIILILIFALGALFISAEFLSISTSEITVSESQQAAPYDFEPLLSESDRLNVNDWNVYRNSYFGYSISYPSPLVVQGGRLDLYGAGYDSDPTIDIDFPLEGRPMAIRVAQRNGYSPEEWADKTIVDFPDNKVTERGDTEIDGRKAHYVVFEGGYFFTPDRVGGAAIKLGELFRSVFIEDDEKMLTVQFPLGIHRACRACSVYPDVLATFRFDR